MVDGTCQNDKYLVQYGMAKHTLKLSDQIRHAVSKCGKSRYQIAQVTGIGEAALSRFVHGERGLSLASLDKLAAYLALEVIVTKPSRGKKE